MPNAAQSSEDGPESAGTANTALWVTGATSGIGAALIAQVPFAARRINIARRANPDTENVRADLSEPSGWDAVDAHFAAVLPRLRADRALLINNAFAPAPVGFIGELDRSAYRRLLQVNVTAPLVLAEAFLRHAPPSVRAGVVMISSASARVPYPGHAAYCAGKAAMEQWVRAVREEIALRQSNAWVVAIRPGAVDTPALRADAAVDTTHNPLVPTIRDALDRGLVDTPDVAASRIWQVLEDPTQLPPVVLLGELISPKIAGRP